MNARNALPFLAHLIRMIENSQFLVVFISLFHHQNGRLLSSVWSRINAHCVLLISLLLMALNHSLAVWSSQTDLANNLVNSLRQERTESFLVISFLMNISLSEILTFLHSHSVHHREAIHISFILIAKRTIRHFCIIRC